MGIGQARFVTAGGYRTRYFEQGDGPPLLLVHGGGFDYRMGIAADDWDGIAGVFVQAGYRVLAPDKLGAGGTDDPASDAEYTMTATVAHLRAFLDALRLDSTVVVGHSRGALPAACLAVEQPDRVRALALLDSNTLPPDDPDGPAPPYFPAGTVLPTAELVRARLVEGFEDAGSPHAADYIARKITATTPGSEPHPGRPIEPIAVERRLRLDREVFRPDLAAVKTRINECIDRAGFPQRTQILWGANDRSAPVRLGLDLFRRAAPVSAEVEFHVFNRGRHLMHVEFPERVGAVIAEFVGRR